MGHYPIPLHQPLEPMVKECQRVFHKPLVTIIMSNKAHFIFPFHHTNESFYKWLLLYLLISKLSYDSMINLWVACKGMTMRGKALLNVKHITFKTLTSINRDRWIKHQTAEPEHILAQAAAPLASLWENLEWILNKNVFPQTCWEL